MGLANFVAEIMDSKSHFETKLQLLRVAIAITSVIFCEIVAFHDEISKKTN